MKKHFLSLLFLLGLIILVWHKVLNLSITGEGYWYFLNGFEGGALALRFDVGAEIIMGILEYVFKDNILLYQGFILVVWIAICLLFYFFVFELTDNKKIAIIASILFSINFGTTYEMLGMGAYQNFLQRVLFLILLLPSFIFFVKFYKTQKFKYSFLSLSFFIIAILSAHFNVFFLPFILAYIGSLLILEKKSRKKTVLLAIHALFFISISMIIIYSALLLGVASYIKGPGFISFLFNNTTSIFYHSFRQLIYLTIPFNAVSGILFSFDENWKHNMQPLYILVSLFYIFAFIYSFKKVKKLRALLLASFLFLPASFVLNMYMRAENVQYLESGSRYLFVPSMGFSIFFGIFLYAISNINKLKAITYMAILCWCLIQVTVVWQEIDKDYYKHLAIKKSIAHIKEISPTLLPHSYVLTPSIVGPWGAAFCKKYYGKQDITYIAMGAPEITWEKSFGRVFNPKQDIIFNYDYQKEQIVDRTKEYKKIIIE